MTAIEALLSGLIDYAGLYPPAALDMSAAVRNYLSYRRGPHARLLGRFVVNLNRLDELRAIAGNWLPEMRLSVIVPSGSDLDRVMNLIDDDGADTAFEFKFNRAAEIERIHLRSSKLSDCYVEVPFGTGSQEFLEQIRAVGARAKLRMGGVTAEAIPSAKDVASTLTALVDRHLAFKATAGLHHPIRSRQPFTHEPDGPAGMMHGFLNLAFAAILLHHDRTAGKPQVILEEEDFQAWQVTSEGIRCRGFLWSTGQIRTTREQFFMSFGSCSFEEPIRDLEVLGWL